MNSEEYSTDEGRGKRIGDDLFAAKGRTQTTPLKVDKISEEKLDIIIEILRDMKEDQRE